MAYHRTQAMCATNQHRRQRPRRRACHRLCQRLGQRLRQRPRQRLHQHLRQRRRQPLRLRLLLILLPLLRHHHLWSRLQSLRPVRQVRSSWFHLSVSCPVSALLPKQDQNRS